MTCTGQAGCRLAELMPSASSTGAMRSSGTIGPKVAGVWSIVTRRSGALPVISTSTMPAGDFCRTLPRGTPSAMART